MPAQNVVSSVAANERPARQRLTRRAVDRLVESGLVPVHGCELIDGDLLTKIPQNKPHATTVRRTSVTLEDVFGRERVSRATPVIVDDENAPEPDVFVVNEPFDGYSDNPTAADIRLVVEVFDSTLRFDRTEKCALYGRANIPEYWIVDINNRRLLVYKDPTVDGFGSLVTHADTDFVALSEATGRPIAVRTLLPDIL